MSSAMVTDAELPEGPEPSEVAPAAASARVTSGGGKCLFLWSQIALLYAGGCILLGNKCERVFYLVDFSLSLFFFSDIKVLSVLRSDLIKRNTNPFLSLSLSFFLSLFF